MLSKERVGMRIRQVRTQQNKTLRDVESASGFSSTHISEIERGRTCPTIGALIQIAGALEKDPSFFIEDRELDEVCVTGREDRPQPPPDVCWVEGTGIVVEGLTAGVLGGRLQAVELCVAPGGSGQITRLPESADLCFYCIQGEALLDIAGRRLPLGPGSSLHGLVDGRFEFANEGIVPSRFLLILDPGTVVP